LVQHRKGKNHKRRFVPSDTVTGKERLTRLACRLRALKAEPYTQKEAEAATGLRTDNGNRNKSILVPPGDHATPMDAEIGMT